MDNNKKREEGVSRVGKEKEDSFQLVRESSEEVEKLLGYMGSILDRVMDVVENKDIEGIRLVEYKNVEKELEQRQIRDVDREAVR
ncbi:MAG: hypothetical protein PWQ91_1222 [Eubacteriales bacterium]|nr:hypothetical protein [Eubacteriales bacterium]MDN5364161.1 hypothetical protein [Eubacteriales bacterium]